MPCWDPCQLMHAYAGIVGDEGLAPIPHVGSLPEADTHAILGSLSKYAAYGGIVADEGSM